MENLEKIICKAFSAKDINKIPKSIYNNIKLIADNAQVRKGVYTVLVSLLYYKYLHPEQDIRLFQTRFEGGFSARTFDTNNVTPILKKMGLPSMAESGWLTRSLEQPYPYDFNYKGAIPPKLKIPFLSVLDYIQKNHDKAYVCLCILLNEVKKVTKQNNIIKPLDNPEKLTIDKIINVLESQFFFKYGVQHGAKLPVLAFHAIYSILILEMSRYNKKHLAPLSSLTACDKTNKASGDIEIFNNDDTLFEAIEIKLDKKIDAQIIRIVRDKIYQWNPKRYYVLSAKGIKEEERNEIDKIVNEVYAKHGCQIIINGLLPTIKYYLRLVTHLEDFINQYTTEINEDQELLVNHKKVWEMLLKELK